MRYIQETTERAIEAERRSAERLQEEQEKTRQEFDRLASRMQNSGIPPEMLQTLTEQHRSEMNALNESRLSQLQQTQDRYEHELKSLRERYEREIQNVQEKNNDVLGQTRTEMQGRIDRMREESERRYDKLNEEWQRRIDQDKQSMRSDRESLDRHNQLQSEHMKSLHESQVRQLESTLNSQIAQERSQHESALAQIKTQYDAQIRMQETSFTGRIDSLNSELERIRADLIAAQSKVMEQGDLASQAKKIKDVNESLGAVFNLGGAAAGAGALAEVDVEPKQEEPKTFWGKLMQFADSPLGEGAFDFLKNMAAGATGMYPMMPGLPGAPPGYGGAPPGYGPPPQPTYAPPPQPTYAPPPQPPYSSVYEPTAEPDVEVMEPGMQTGRVIEDDEVEHAGPAQENPQVEAPPQPQPQPQPQPEDPTKGAFGGVAYGRGPDISPEEVESLHNQDTKPPAQPNVQQPQPPSAPQMQEIPPEAAQQLRGMIEGLEDSMSSGLAPNVLAGTIIKMAPPEQVQGMVQTSISQFLATIQQLAPESMLLTFHGRKYLTALQQSLAQQTQQPTA